MDSEDSRKIIALLEEIRDGQRVTIENQAQALARQEEALGMARERQASSTQRDGRFDAAMAQADQFEVRSARLTNRIFLSNLIALAFLLLIIVVWLAFASARA